MADRIQIKYVEVSAKSGDGVEAMFEVLSKELNEKFKDKNKAFREDAVILVTSTARNTSEDRLCCNIC